MSSKHLKTGSTQPPKSEGKIRLYSMEYCPFAQRVRLVLNAKKIEHDIINLDLVHKPEWYAREVNPTGKIPALDIGSKVLVESLDICDYLDETYPEPVLYPSDPNKKQKLKDLSQKIALLSAVLIKLLDKREEKSAEEWLKEFMPNLKVFENALKEGGKTFFHGDEPGMLDYMLWPFAERSGAIFIVLGTKLPLQADDIPHLRAWLKEMKKHPIVEGTYRGPEKCYKAIQIEFRQIVGDFDEI